MDDDWMTKRLRTLISQGVLDEDPDGLLWMSAKMRDIIKEFNEDRELHALIRRKAKDEDDFKTGCWTLLYMKFMEETPAPDVGESVHILKKWNLAADDNRLDEWSMRLRLR